LNTEKKLDYQLFKELYSFVQPYKIRFIGLVVLMVLGAVTAPLLPLVVQKTIDGPIANGDSTSLLSYLMIMIGILVLNSILTFFSTYESGWVSQKIIHNIRLKVYKKTLNLKLKYYDNTPIGRLVTRTISDVETLSEVFSSGLAALVGDLLQLFVILGLLFFLNWKLTLVSISTIPLLIFSTYIFKELVKKSFDEVRTHVSNLNAFLQERITGMNLIQIFDVRKQQFKKFDELNTNHKKAQIRNVLYYSVYFPVSDLISAISIGLIVWYGAKGVISEDISFGMITAFIMYSNQFFRPIRMIADRVNTIQMGMVSIERILEILDNKDSVERNDGVSHQIEGELKFEDVWFAYNEPNWTLRGISFELHKGQSLAFVGPTGAGKTSTINLLSGFYEFQKGKVLVDGIDITTLSLESVRKQVGIVLQDVFLFRGSIMDNLKLGDPTISDERVIQASKEVGIHDFITKLPNQYAYEVMERGSTLSMGQRQLISFVRVLVHNPRILILDEATSSIDSESEELIQNAIEKIMKNRTSIVIAHRLSTIQKADKIIVLEKGEIKEEGNHETLMNKKGTYAKLVEVQFNNVQTLKTA
jgi:ATP-binding cassette subfamily B multidrug efflux pump